MREVPAGHLDRRSALVDAMLCRRCRRAASVQTGLRNAKGLHNIWSHYRLLCAITLCEGCDLSKVLMSSNPAPRPELQSTKHERSTDLSMHSTNELLLPGAIQPHAAA